MPKPTPACPTPDAATMPTEGGSYTRCPTTGVLQPQQQTQQAEAVLRRAAWDADAGDTTSAAQPTTEA